MEARGPKRGGARRWARGAPPRGELRRVPPLFRPLLETVEVSLPVCHVGFADRRHSRRALNSALVRAARLCRGTGSGVPRIPRTRGCSSGASRAHTRRWRASRA